jgi:AcrR family transcriptional regulator
MQRLSKPARRAQLLDAAASAFVAAGFDGTSMETVAERAGVTRLIVYRHFETKQALYEEVLWSVVDPLRAGFVPGAPGGVAPLLVHTARAHPDAFRLLWRHARHEPTFARQAAMFRQITADFADDVIRFHVGDEALRRWGSATLVEYLFGGICEWLDHGDPAADDRFVDVLRAGAQSLIRAWSASVPGSVRSTVAGSGE